MNDPGPGTSARAIRLRLLACLVALSAGMAALVVAILLVRGTLG
jgi:hypothetical protein